MSFVVHNAIIMLLRCYLSRRSFCKLRLQRSYIDPLSVIFAVSWLPYRINLWIIHEGAHNMVWLNQVRCPRAPAAWLIDCHRALGSRRHAQQVIKCRFIAVMRSVHVQSGAYMSVSVLVLYSYECNLNNLLYSAIKSIYEMHAFEDKTVFITVFWHA